MSKQIKLCIALVMIVLLFSCCIVNAYGKDSFSENNSLNDRMVLAASERDTNSYPVLKKFLDNAFNSNPSKSVSLHVYDKQNKDVTMEWKNTVQDLYTQSKYEEIVKYIKEDGIQLVTEEKEIENTKGAVQTERFSEIFYEIGSASGYTKEWTVRLTGTVTYNTNTHVITSASSPTLSIEWASWGALWSPWLNNVSTSSTISSSYVTFRGTYTMMGSLSSPLYLPSQTYNFGTYTESFSAYPAF